MATGAERSDPKPISIIRGTNAEFVASQERAQALKEELVAPGLGILDSLRDEIDAQPMASRFGHDKVRPTHTGRILARQENPTSAGAKKAQMEADIQGLKSRLIILGQDLEVLVMDIEATRQE